MPPGSPTPTSPSSDGPSWIRDVYAAAQWGKSSALESLLSEPEGDINEPDKFGRTALHMACFGGHEQCARFLLDGGADVSVKNPSGETPLHRAAVQGHLSCVKLLLKAGANAAAKSNNGSKPIDCAKSKPNNQSVIAALHAAQIGKASVSTPRGPQGIDDIKEQLQHERELLRVMSEEHQSAERAWQEERRKSSVTFQAAKEEHERMIEDFQSEKEKLEDISRRWREKATHSQKALLELEKTMSIAKRGPKTNDQSVQTADDDGMRQPMATDAEGLDEIPISSDDESQKPTPEAELAVAQVELKRLRSLIQEMEVEIATLRARNDELNKTLSKRKQPTARPEVEWQPDVTESKCRLCTVEYTFLNRRHHCRLCGLLCCNDCSMNRRKLGGKSERVCDSCEA